MDILENNNWILSALIPVLFSGLSTYITIFITNLLNKKKIEKESLKLSAETEKLEAETNKISSDAWKEYAEKIDKMLQQCKDDYQTSMRKLESRICSLEDENIKLKTDLANEKFARQELEFKLDKWKNWATKLAKQLKEHDIQPVIFD